MIEIIEGEIVEDAPPPAVVYFILASPGQSWQPPPKHQPSTRELLREHVSNLRPLVLRPIVNTKQEITMNQNFDENDTPWATWEMLAAAGALAFLLAAGVLAWLAWGG